MSISMRVDATWSDLDDLAGALTDEFDEDQLIELIRGIDQDMANVEFTEKLIRLAKRLKKELKVEYK